MTQTTKETADQDIAEKMAADIALTMNGGEWKDGKWYSKGHREAWIKAVQPYADEIERLRTGNRLHLELAEIKDAEIERLRNVVALLIEYEEHDENILKGAVMWEALIEAAHRALMEKE